MSKFVDYEGLTYDDVLIVPNLSHIKSRSEVSLDCLFGAHPVIPANMSTCCGEEMADFILSTRGTAILHRYMPDDEFFRLAEKYNNKVYYSVGAWHNDRIRIEKLLNLGIRNFCVDIAHGHSYLAGATVERIKELNKKATVIAGNVATLDGVLYLSKCGADIVKIGVGPGSICSTRTQTGVGIPQLTALLECSKAGVMLIADGGFKTPGDIAKALAIENVEGVMTGSMFAGTDKTPDWVDGGKTVYAGMASKEIQKRIKGKESNIEGISYNVECAPEGSTAAALSSILDGIRSALSYTGNGDLYEFRYNSRFIKVSSHTTIENSPHFKLWNK